VGVAGALFLSKKGDAAIAWQMPWVLLVLLAGLQLALLPFQAILDGCKQIERMSFIRLIGAVLGSLSFWVGVTSGLGLWSACMMIGMNVGAQIVLITVHYRRFFGSLLAVDLPKKISWKDEILPLQWRLAVAGVANYFANSLFTPVIFAYFGSRMAGQMGMGWQIMLAAQSIAFTLVQVQVPTFGNLISQAQYEALDQLFRKAVLYSLGGLIGLSAVAWTIVKVLYEVPFKVAERFMPPFPLFLFLLAAVFMHIPQCQAAYLRAHKKEPLLAVGLVANLFTGACVWFFGRTYGMTGAAGAYAAIAGLVTLPWVWIIWSRARREWHA
jgi:O-antigen/teichoic acid export membrane protein